MECLDAINYDLALTIGVGIVVGQSLYAILSVVMALIVAFFQ